MPTVPRLTNQQVSATPLRTVQRAPSNTGEVFQLAARTTQEVGSVFGEIRDREQLETDRASVLEADRMQGERENSLLFDPDNGAYSRQGKNALGVRQSVLEELDKNASQTLEGLTSPRAKRIFQQSWTERRQRVEQGLARHESQERQRYQDDEAAAGVNLAVEDASLRWNDPQAVQESLRKQQSIIGLQAERKGWSPEQRKQAELAAAEKTHTGVLGGMLAAQDYARAKSYLDENRGSFSPAMQQQADKAISAERVEGIASGIAERFRSSISAGDAALAKLDELDVSDAEKLDVRSKVRTGIGILYDERSRQYAGQTSTLERAISSDNPPDNAETEARRLYQVGAYTPTQYTNVLEGIDRARVNRAKETAAAAEISGAISGGLPLDPNSKAHRDALSGLFKQETQGMPVGSAPWQALATTLAARTRMLPDQASQWVRQSLRSPDFGQAARAAEFYGAVQASAPDAVSSFDKDSKAFAQTVSDMIKAGTPPEKAAELARHNVFDANEAVIENRKKRYTTGAEALGKGSDTALTSFIDRDFDPGILPSFLGGKAQPIASAEMSTDFNSLTEQYYLRTGDIDSARNAAWSDLKRVYGVSEINGTRMMMPLPPEKFGVTREMVQSEMSEFLKANPPEDGSQASDLMLVPDSLTLREVGSAFDGKTVRPGYRIIKKNGDLLTDANGVPVRYEVPSSEELSSRIEAAKAKAAEAEAAKNAQRVEAAKRERQAQADRFWEPSSSVQ